MIVPELKQLLNKVTEFLDSESSGHDIDHALRVYKTAMFIQKNEGGDKIVVGAAALVHDICRPWEKKTGKLHFGPEALKIIEAVLLDAEINQEKINPILSVVKYHDTYDWGTENQQKSIELQIVQDADNIDALGAMGIARTFRFGGAYKLPMYVQGENLNFDSNYHEDPNTRPSSIAHFYEKLLKLQRNLNTKTGKSIGLQRHTFIVQFLDQFFSEWESKFE